MVPVPCKNGDIQLYCNILNYAFLPPHIKSPRRSVRVFVLHGDVYFPASVRHEIYRSVRGKRPWRLGDYRADGVKSGMDGRPRRSHGSAGVNSDGFRQYVFK